MGKRTAQLVATTGLLVMLAALTGCDGSMAMTEPASEFSLNVDADLTISHSLGQGILRLVNSELADRELLEGEAELDFRAVDEILLKRLGPDGEAGTIDDDRFEDLFELDAVPYVDTAALVRLGQISSELDLVPILIIEGVFFSAGELNSTVLLANFGSLAELDIGARLDLRAAEALIQGRPYEDLWRIADRPYVGSGSLESLRNFSRIWLSSQTSEEAPDQREG